MSLDFLKKAARKQPIRPFVSHLAGGRSLPVRSPEFIELPAEGRLAVVYHPSGSTHIVDLLLVTDIEFPRTE
jgi:hypothetical protein